MIVRTEWHNADDQCLVVEIEADHDRPDLMDDMTHRVATLMREALGAVFGIEAESKETP